MPQAVKVLRDALKVGGRPVPRAHICCFPFPPTRTKVSFLPADNAPLLCLVLRLPMSVDCQDLKAKNDTRCLAIENNVSGVTKRMEDLEGQATAVRATNTIERECVCLRTECRGPNGRRFLASDSVNNCLMHCRHSGESSTTIHRCITCQRPSLAVCAPWKQTWTLCWLKQT